MPFVTFVKSDEVTWPDQQQDNDKDKDNDNDKDKLVTCDTDYTGHWTALAIVAMFYFVIFFVILQLVEDKKMSEIFSGLIPLLEESQPDDRVTRHTLHHLGCTSCIFIFSSYS